MTLKNAAGDEHATPTGRPAPPKGYLPGCHDMGRPPCFRCVRENGITVHGRRLAPQPSDIHPDHVSVGESGRVEHAGPREPLCAHHAELAAWESKGKALGYPPPAWTREPRGAVHVARVLERLERSLSSPTKGMSVTDQTEPTRERDEVTRARARYVIEREPGEEG